MTRVLNHAASVLVEKDLGTVFSSCQVCAVPAVRLTGALQSSISKQECVSVGQAVGEHTVVKEILNSFLIDLI